MKKEEAPSCWNCKWANWIRVYLWYCTWSMRLRMTPQYKCKKHDWIGKEETNDSSFLSFKSDQ